MANDRHYRPNQREFIDAKTQSRHLPNRLQPQTDHKVLTTVRPSPERRAPQEKAAETASSRAAAPSLPVTSSSNATTLDTDPNRYEDGGEVLRIRGGREKGIVYYPRRILPPGGTRPLLTEHTVQQGDRLDLIANQYYGDPLLYWEIADANNAMKPEDLLRVGNRLLIPNLS